MNHQLILDQFRNLYNFPAEERLTVSKEHSNFLVVMRSTADGDYISTYHLRGIEAEEGGRVIFTATEAMDMDAYQSEVFDSIWPIWKQRLSSGDTEVELMPTNETSEVFNFTHFENIGGNVNEGMMPVWANLDDHIESMGYKTILSKKEDRVYTISAWKRS